ncbi:MAG: hypothetical protein ACUVUC_02125 [Thermoguttaceae bacterium]
MNARAVLWWRVVVALGLAARLPPAPAEPPEPITVTDYDEGDFYLVRGGQRFSYHGMRDSWVFNRAMSWLDSSSGVDGAVLCYCQQSPLLLTGTAQVSRWYTGEGNELADVDEQFTRFTKRNPHSAWDHAALPPLQFQIEQHPRAELEVSQATHPWQFLAVIKGRSGPPLYASPWHKGPGRLTVDLLKLYRQKGYHHHFAEMNFFLATWTEQADHQASVLFRLCLKGEEAIIPCLPVIRTVLRAERQGVPLYAVVLDRQARRLGRDTVLVTATLGKKTVSLSEDGRGIWRVMLRGLPVGDHQAQLRAVWKANPHQTASSVLRIRVTDGQFIGYDPGLRLLTRAGRPLGPLSGSYRGQPVFRGIGTARESFLHGQLDWQLAILEPSRPDYGFHFWESLTERELDADYAYLRRCGWDLIHLCQGWLWWPRLDAAGRLAPFGAEQLATVCQAAGRHGLRVHLALSHYPLGKKSPPYAQYLEAGFQPEDYRNPKSRFFRMFGQYLEQFAAVFRDETALSSFTAAGEGDPDCGALFVNMVYDQLQAHDGNHLVMAEPHHQITQHPNYYRHQGWKPLLGGMRTYGIDRLEPEHLGVKFKLAAMGHLFMAEGCFYGFLGGNHQYMNAQMPIDSYRGRLRQTLYTGLALRNPMLLTWEERIVEDERVVLAQVCRAVDWTKRFQTPPIAIRVDAGLMPVGQRGPLVQYEKALSRMPLECCYVWQDEAVPEGTLYTIDARKGFFEPAFVSAGGRLPDALKAHMPLGLPAGLAASYSWSEDRRTLLAYIRRTDRGGPDGKALPAVLRIQNFPDQALAFRLFDLDAKQPIREGTLRRTATLEVPGRCDGLFLVISETPSGGGGDPPDRSRPGYPFGEGPL